MGSVRVPGSKSLTNRHLLLAALAEGRSALSGALHAQDTWKLATALGALGAIVEGMEEGRIAEGLVRVAGAGGRLKGGAVLHCGDGGTPARFLLAASLLASGPVTVDGSARLRERPMADAGPLLAALGARCEWLGQPGCLPVRVHPATQGHAPSAVHPGASGALARPVVTVGQTASSQFVSGLLLVGPWLPRGLEVQFTQPPTSASYLELTVHALRQWGAQVAVTRTHAGALASIAVDHGPLAARTVAVEADASSAVYWAAAAALVQGSELELFGLPLTTAQPDILAVRALGALGAQVRDTPAGVVVAWADAAEDAGGTERGSGGAARGPALRAGHVDATLFPDGALAVIAASAAAAGPVRFTGLGTLRVKESDRIQAMCDNLARVSVATASGPDWLEVRPAAGGPATAGAALTGPSTPLIPTFADHRVAMSFAALALRNGPLAIQDPRCTAKSYPSFWAHLRALRVSCRA